MDLFIRNVSWHPVFIISSCKCSHTICFMWHSRGYQELTWSSSVLSLHFSPFSERNSHKSSVYCASPGLFKGAWQELWEILWNVLVWSWRVHLPNAWPVFWLSFHLSWVFVVVVQSLSCIWLFVTPWTAACHAPLSSAISWSLLKFMSIEQVKLKEETEQAPSWKQDSILGQTVDFELYAWYLCKQHTNWETRSLEGRAPGLVPRYSIA